eukprot:CAMPEP_0184390774 /NCGR_PEP_ID=MMETSP0007-20130409/13575_1 /TAXON_ID=97485 /ORGANISM="Prymnesium parvum, Strain Texoma1" /LENGTH=99 /DNA_ID=CAMNT_0026740647 /DNA_START=299 /DNA_END=598 /DNA_ORIENTATION=-
MLWAVLAGVRSAALCGGLYGLMCALPWRATCSTLRSTRGRAAGFVLYLGHERPARQDESGAHWPHSAVSVARWAMSQDGEEAAGSFLVELMVAAGVACA